MSRPAGAVSYASLLRLPGALPAFAAAAVLRLSYAAVVLSLLLVVQEATGSFAVAGSAVGAYALPSLLAPYKSRLVDRRGARGALTALGASYAVVLSAIAACACCGVDASVAYLLLAAAAGVLSPPAGPVMRGIWAGLTPGDEVARSRAYSLDTVAEEGLFAAGPLLVGAVVAAANTVAALAVTAALALVGAGGLGLSKAARAVSVPAAAGSRRCLLGPLLRPGVRWIVFAMLAAGFALAPLEVAVVARATQAGSPEAAGYLLAVLSVGSVAGGLLWGRLHHAATAGRLIGVLAVLGAGTAAAGFVPSLPGLGAVLALTGAAVAPAFVTAYLLADRFVDDSVRTETGTWVGTAANVGGAVGAAVAGLIVEHISARAAFVVGSGVLIVLLPVLITTRPHGGQAQLPPRCPEWT